MTASRPLQVGPRRPKTTPRSSQDHPKTASGCLKTALRQLQDAPGPLQDGHKSAQDGPGRLQGSRKTSTRPLQIGAGRPKSATSRTKTPQDRLKIVVWQPQDHSKTLKSAWRSPQDAQYATRVASERLKMASWMIMES